MTTNPIPIPKVTATDIVSAKVQVQMASGVTYDIELVPAPGLFTLVGEIDLSVDIAELPPEDGWRRFEPTGRKMGTANLSGDVKTAIRRPAPPEPNPGESAS